MSLKFIKYYQKKRIELTSDEANIYLLLSVFKITSKSKEFIMLFLKTCSYLPDLLYKRYQGLYEK